MYNQSSRSTFMLSGC